MRAAALMLAANSKSNQNGYFSLSLQPCVTHRMVLFFFFNFNMSNTVTLERNKSAQFYVLTLQCIFMVGGVFVFDFPPTHTHPVELL